MIIRFNDEQCKHLAVTLRTLSLGLCLPTLLYLLGLNQAEIGPVKVTVMAGLAITAEASAYRLLKQFDGHDSDDPHREND